MDGPSKADLLLVPGGEWTGDGRPDRATDTRRWAYFRIGAGMCDQDTGVVHGPAVSVRHERAMRPGMSEPRRGWAADRAYVLLLERGAIVSWRRQYDTGVAHGPNAARVP